MNAILLPIPESKLDILNGDLSSSGFLVEFGDSSFFLFPEQYFTLLEGLASEFSFDDFTPNVAIATSFKDIIIIADEDHDNIIRKAFFFIGGPNNIPYGIRVKISMKKISEDLIELIDIGLNNGQVPKE